MNDTQGKLSLVIIEWLDSYGVSSSWNTIELPLSPHALSVVSVGWLAHDGDDTKVLIPHVVLPSGDIDAQGCGDMTIPTVAITRIFRFDPEHSVSVG